MMTSILIDKMLQNIFVVMGECNVELAFNYP